MDQFEDLFSLEDDDCSQLFITQEPKEKNMELIEINGNQTSNDSGIFLGNPVTDFKSLCVSLSGSNNINIYSDISEDEFDKDSSNPMDNE